MVLDEDTFYGDMYTYNFYQRYLQVSRAFFLPYTSPIYPINSPPTKTKWSNKVTTK